MKLETKHWKNFSPKRSKRITQEDRLSNLLLSKIRTNPRKADLLFKKATCNDSLEKEKAMYKNLNKSLSTYLCVDSIFSSTSNTYLYPREFAEDKNTGPNFQEPENKIFTMDTKIKSFQGQISSDGTNNFDDLLRFKKHLLKSLPKRSPKIPDREWYTLHPTHNKYEKNQQVASEVNNIIQKNCYPNSNEEAWKESIIMQLIPLIYTTFENISIECRCPSKNVKIIKINNLILHYHCHEKHIIPNTHTQGILRIIMQHIIKNTIPHQIFTDDIQHNKKIKEVITYIENSRVSLTKRRRIRWHKSDMAHHLGLLLLLLSKGNLLPYKPKTTLQKILKHTENKIWTDNPKGNAVIYYAFSSVSNDDYVGQTKHLTIRRHQEITAARAYFRKLKNGTADKRNTRLVDKIMGTIKYTTWYHWPILGTNTISY